MQVLKLKIDNAFSFGSNVEIDFTKLNTHTQLVGVNEEENNESNGSGKTSIPLCIQECLYSKNAKGIKKDNIQNREINKGYKISLSFQVGEEIYETVTTRTNSGKGTILLKHNGIDISSHTMRGTLAKIEEIIGLDWHTFVQLTYQSNDKTFDILKATEATRAKLLVGLFGLDSYTEQTDNAKEMLKRAKSELTEITNKAKRLEIDANLDIEDNLLLEMMDGDEHEKYVEIADELEELTKELGAIDSHNLRVEEEALRVKTNNTARDTVLRQINKLKEELSGREEVEYSQEDMDDTLRDIHTTEAEIQSLFKEIKVYGEEPKNCRECGAPVKTGFNKDKLDFAKEQKKISNEILCKLKKRKDELYAANNYNNITSGIKTKIKRLEEGLVMKRVMTLSSKSSSEIAEKVSVAKQLLEEHKRELARISEVNRKVEVHNALQADRLERKEKAESEIKELNIEKAVIREANCGVLYDALGKLTKFKLENLLITLQDAVNQYMSIFFKVDTALLISLKNNKLSFTILKNGTEVMVESLSGGEYSRVATALLFAVRESLSRFNGVTVDLLVLDEVLATLDSGGVESLYQVIEELDCKVLSISHSVYDNKLDCITVIKNAEGISRVEL